MNNIYIDPTTRAVYYGLTMIGHITVRNDTTFNVYDHRDDIGYVGIMNYEQVINYFNDYEDK